MSTDPSPNSAGFPAEPTPRRVVPEAPLGSAGRDISSSANSRPAGAPTSGQGDGGPMGAGLDDPSKAGKSPSNAPAGMDRDAMARKAPVTRAAVVWVAVAVGLVVLVLLIIFFIQNQDQVLVRFLGFEGSLALGLTLFIAAVGGGILVALAGGARIIQLRLQDHRRRRLAKP
jgi:uncharacterized integral membrane protein